MKIIAQELLTAWDAGSIVPSIVERHPAFHWDDANAICVERIMKRTARKLLA